MSSGSQEDNLLSTPQFPPITGKHFTRKGFCFHSHLNSRSSAEISLLFIQSLNMNKQFSNSSRRWLSFFFSSATATAPSIIIIFRIKRIWMDRCLWGATQGVRTEGIRSRRRRRWYRAKGEEASNNGNEFEINWK